MLASLLRGPFALSGALLVAVATPVFAAPASKSMPTTSTSVGASAAAPKPSAAVSSSSASAPRSTSPSAPPPVVAASAPSIAASTAASVIVTAGAPSMSVAVVPPGPRISIGYARLVRGEVLPRGIDSVLQAVAPNVERCYDKAIAARDDGNAFIDLRLEVVGPGVVAAVTVSGSHDASDTLRSCLHDLFFDENVGASGPEPVVVDFNITFDRDIPPTHVRPLSACSDVCNGEITDDLYDQVTARANAASICFIHKPAPGEPRPLPAGRVEVLLRIAPDGSACGATTAGDAFGRPSLTTCLIETLSKPYKLSPGGCVDVEVPIVFRGR